MSPSFERRLLQATIGILCLSPLFVGVAGITGGLHPFGEPAPQPDADSHFRYLSGIYFMLAPVALSCIPTIERRGERFAIVVLLVFGGGLARLWGIASGPAPSLGHQVGLGLELIVTPAVGLWQWSLQRRWRRRGPARVSPRD